MHPDFSVLTTVATFITDNFRGSTASNFIPILKPSTLYDIWKFWKQKKSNNYFYAAIFAFNLIEKFIWHFFVFWNVSSCVLMFKRITVWKSYWVFKSYLELFHKTWIPTSYLINIAKQLTNQNKLFSSSTKSL